MKLYFDENFSPHLVRGFQAFQAGRPGEEVEAIYLCDEVGRGCADEEWIPLIGKQCKNGEKCVVLTQDLNINRVQAQNELYKQHGVSFFFFHPPKKKGFTYWDWIKQVMKHWETMKTILREENRPFGYSISVKMTKPQKLGNH